MRLLEQRPMPSPVLLRAPDPLRWMCAVTNCAVLGKGFHSCCPNLTLNRTLGLAVERRLGHAADAVDCSGLQPMGLLAGVWGNFPPYLAAQQDGLLAGWVKHPAQCPDRGRERNITNPNMCDQYIDCVPLHILLAWHMRGNCVHGVHCP